MKYNIQGIPTYYDSIRFRSRLEAKWAMLFNDFGWEWEYEPIDLNGWIPDFILTGQKGTEILVEVKPYARLEKFEEVIKKIERATRSTNFKNTEVLLLGRKLLEAESWSHQDKKPLAIGWLGEVFTEDKAKKYDYGKAVLNNSCGFGFIHDYNSYKDRITELHDGDHYVCFPDIERVRKMWKNVGNKVQWEATYETH